MLMRRIPKSKIQGVHEQLCFLHHLLHLLLCSVVSKIARGCSGKNGIFKFLPPLARQHWAGIGCTEIGQLVGVIAVASPLFDD